jgi:hypothetical protein
MTLVYKYHPVPVSPECGEPRQRLTRLGRRVHDLPTPSLPATGGLNFLSLMAQQRTPFDSIEGTLEYIDLLRETIQTTRSDIQKEIVRAKSERAERRLEALQLVTYKLEQLSRHIDTSQRLLNDLRTLRRLLLGER